jgi:hypothetical protein
MADEPIREIYLLHVWIRQISPMIWRRLLVRGDSTLADLHHTLQIAFGWTDAHLHRFRIHGRDYGLSRVGGLAFSHDARTVRLESFQFHPNEWFPYEYDLRDSWQHQVRVERRLAGELGRTYPVCIGGRRAAPPEDCGGPRAFQERRDAVPWQVREHLERIIVGVDADDLDAVRDELDAVESLREWLMLGRFDRRVVNHRLRLYAAGDERCDRSYKLGPLSSSPRGPGRSSRRALAGWSRRRSAWSTDAGGRGTCAPGRSAPGRNRAGSWRWNAAADGDGPAG